MFKKIPSLFLIICIYIVLQNNIYADKQKKIDVPKKDSYWINLGLLGIGTYGLAMNSIISYQFGQNIISIRGAITTEIFGGNSVEEVSILYGYNFSDVGLFSLGIGISYYAMWKNRDFSFFGKPDYTQGSFSNGIGIALECQMIGKVFNFFGIGLYCFANINADQFYMGCTLNLQFGKLN